jgi:cytochrome c peroxidase
MNTYTTKNNRLTVTWEGIVFILLLSCVSGCTEKDPVDEITKTPQPLEIKVPANFPNAVYDLSANPPTKEGFELGRKIFYDSRLSRTNTISCGFCHMQPSGFTHHGHDVSHGVDDQLGRRNSLPIQNLLFYKTFFWDGGVNNLDLVALNAIGNKVEMDEDLGNIINKIKNDADYKLKFRNAFGSEEITSTRFLQSLSQFLAAMVSSNSKYDMFIRKENNVSLTDLELQGMDLFKQNCAACHATDLFTDQTYRNNGYSSTADLERDKGREEITLNAADIGKFKVPSLRNVEYTAPYMHNGKLERLENVLDFYTTGLHDSPTLDPLLKQNGKLGFDLSNQEKAAIIAFLRTLSDEQYMSDRKFSEY